VIFLSEKLVINQGLQLQKAKTRIMSSQEFIATNPFTTTETDDTLTEADETPPAARDAPELTEQSQNLLRFSMRFDRYSPTARADYEALKAEIQKYDVIALLKAELSKSRVHISLSRKIVSAIRYIDDVSR